MDELFSVSQQYFDDATKAFAQSLVGKCMKRFELSEDKEEIKKAVKELIYESTRDLKAQIKAFSTGVKFIAPRKG